MTVYSFWGACVAVIVAFIALRAIFNPAKATAVDERSNWQPTGGQDSMINNSFVTDCDSGGDGGCGDGGGGGGD